MTDQHREEDVVIEKMSDHFLQSAESSMDHTSAHDQPLQPDAPDQPQVAPPDHQQGPVEYTPESPVQREILHEQVDEPPVDEGEKAAPTEVEDTTFATADEASNEPTAATDEQTTTDETVETTEPTEPVTDLPQNDTPSSDEADSSSDAVAPAAADEAEGAAAPAAAEAVATEEGDGASFTPVDEDDSRPRRLKDLEVGMELEGRITSIALYGVFVDVGVGRDGLVHISEMSDTRINSPSDLVQIGDVVNVRVKGLDLDARRISLSMRPPREEASAESEPRRAARSRRPDVDRDKLAELAVGEMVDGTITGLSSFGAFVDIGVGKDGLVHISELAEGRIEKPEDSVQVGETYRFKLLEVDPEGSRISLSLRRAQRLQRMRELEPGQFIEGRVSGLAAFGAFVDIGVGRDGLVHISQLSPERIEKVEDVVNVGDAVTVRVLEVDPQNKRISLTMRPEVEPGQEEDPGASDGTVSSGEAHTPDESSPYAVTASVAEERSRQEQQNRRRGGQRSERSNSPAQTPDVYTVDDESDEGFTGNATLEDLMQKFGGSYRKDKDRSRQRQEEDDDDEDGERKRQRDAIRRTLKRDNKDE